ncbi:MAG: hypothetical protein H8E76_06845 [Helicobacteraceae bacterium]|nr:hypothetical protein [Candidatus Sulfurimonas ponti]MBL6973898.1 hypothetical protein [Sulfurimonas sp.]
MSKRKVWNLHGDESISSMKNVFNICNQQDIEEFWLFYQEKCVVKSEEVTYLIIKYLFDYTAKFLEQVDSFDIIIEHQDKEEITYITFWHQTYTEMLRNTYVDLKKYPYFNLKINEEKVTFQIIKEEETPEIQEVPKITQNTALKGTSKKALIVYDFINSDDLITMQEINGELLNQMFYISSSHIDDDKLSTIIKELDSYIAIFSKYSELTDISVEISSFRDVLEENISKIIENTNADLNLFFEGIISNLKNWADMSFVKGIEDINYYNASIHSDISMIKYFLQIDEVANLQDDEDIFF